MPRFEFREENIRKNDYDYARFKLEKGETARIVLLEDPWGEYVHLLQKPKLVGGVAQMTQKKRRDGTFYEDYEYDFVSQVLCLGDEGVLREDGSDPKGCPVCAEAVKSDKFKAPKLRYAVHVVKYDTKADGTVKEPFGATTEIWAFSERVFGELYGFKKEWGSLAKHDLIVHREPNTLMSGVYKIQVAKKAAWLEDEKRKAYISQLIAPENLAPDLAIFCGTRKSDTKLGYDIQSVNEAWAVATGVNSLSRTDDELSSVGSSLGLSESLSDLLDGSNSADEAAVDANGWAKEGPSEEVVPATSLAALGISDEASEDDDDDDEVARLLANLK